MPTKQDEIIKLFPEHTEAVPSAPDIYLCSREAYTGKEKLTELYREAVENMDESVRIDESYKCRYDAEK